MKKRRCDYCNKKIRVMTPPQQEDEWGMAFFCSEICRKEHAREITPEQGKVIRSAALKASPKEN